MKKGLLLLCAAAAIACGADALDGKTVKVPVGGGVSLAFRAESDGSFIAEMSHTNQMEKVVVFALDAAGLEGYWLAHDLVRDVDEGQYARYYASSVPAGTVRRVQFFPRAAAKFLPVSRDTVAWQKWIDERARHSPKVEPPCEHCAARQRGW